MNLIRYLLAAFIYASQIGYAAEATIATDHNLDSRIAEAQALLSAKKFTELKPLLASLRAEKPPPLEVLFISGMLASQQGDYTNAASEFRAMLVRDPSLIRPRLELALALQKSGNRRDAKYQYDQVLAASLPEQVRENIYNQLSDIQSRSPSLNLSLEVVSDSNPNQAPNSSTVYIGGLPFTLNNSSAKSAYGVALSGDLRWPLASDPTWFAHAYAEVNEYGKRDFNSIYAQATVGKHLDWGWNNLTTEVGAHVSNYQGHPQYDGWLVRSTGFIRASDQWGLSVDAAYKKYNYDALSFLDGNMKSLTLTSIYIPKPTQRWELGAGINQYSAKESAYSYTQPQVSIHFTKEWSGGWITGAQLQALVADYDTSDPFFGVVRRDKEARVEFDLLNRKIQLGSFYPKILIGYVNRSSTLDLFNYNRVYAHIIFSAGF